MRNELNFIERELGDENVTGNELQEKELQGSIKFKEKQRESEKKHVSETMRKTIEGEKDQFMENKSMREIEIHNLPRWDKKKIAKSETGDMGSDPKNLQKKEFQFKSDKNQGQIEMTKREEETIVPKKIGYAREIGKVMKNELMREEKNPCEFCRCGERNSSKG